MAGYKTDRTGEDIRRELVLRIKELKDPRVKDKMLTVVRVETSSDLSVAKAYVSALEGLDAAKDAVKGLQSAAGYLRREIGQALHLRKAPELRFIADDSVERGMEIFQKMREISGGEDA